MIKATTAVISLTLFLLFSLIGAIAELFFSDSDGNAELDSILTRASVSTDFARIIEGFRNPKSKTAALLPYQTLSVEQLVRLIGGHFAAYSIRKERSLRRYVHGESLALLVLANLVRVMLAGLLLWLLLVGFELLTGILRNLSGMQIPEEWILAGLLMGLAMLISGIPISVYRFLHFRSERRIFLKSMRSLLDSLQIPEQLLREIGQRAVAVKNPGLFHSLYARAVASL